MLYKVNKYQVASGMTRCLQFDVLWIDLTLKFAVKSHLSKWVNFVLLTCRAQVKTLIWTNDSIQIRTFNIWNHTSLDWSRSWEARGLVKKTVLSRTATTPEVVLTASMDTVVVPFAWKPSTKSYCSAKTDLPAFANLADTFSSQRLAHL